MIGSRTKHKGTGCPYCSGRFPTKEKNFKNSRPNLVKEFHPTKNGNLKIESLTIYSGKKVWWLCSKGHEWMTRVSHRSNGSNCPECFNISRKKC
jgi:DNA-directed RNA polymerase subunit RPC12/RpoP